MSHQIIRIKEKLSAVQHTPLPKDDLPFGVEAHLYQMLPPMTPKVLSSFEREHSVVLPAGYRQFLLDIGNGGAGPYYGLLPLSKWDLALWRELDEPKVSMPSVDIIASPSPLCEDVYADDWVEHLPFLEWGPYQGTMTICDQGCSYKSLLIVTGESRGRIVNIDEDLQPPKFAPFPDFLSWYEAWLDETLVGNDSFWFGYPVKQQT